MIALKERLSETNLDDCQKFFSNSKIVLPIIQNKKCKLYKTKYLLLRGTRDRERAGWVLLLQAPIHIYIQI
jgi:hypothetical protein